MNHIQDRILKHLAIHREATSADLASLYEEGDEQTRAKRINYHLSRLEKLGKVHMVRQGDHGKKYYRLTHSPPHISRYDAIIESRHLIRHAYSTWGETINAALIECSGKSEKEIADQLDFLIPTTNDAICLADIVPAQIGSRLRTAIAKAQQTLVVSANIAHTETEPLMDMHLPLILRIDPHNPINHDPIDHAQSKRHPIYLQNISLKMSPMFFGTLGPYSFDEKEYAQRTGSVHACAQNTILIDVHTYLSEHSTSQLRDLLLSSARSLCTSHLELRRRAHHLFPRSMFGEDFLSLSRHYFRFWNYGLKQEGIDHDTVMLLLETSKEGIETMSKSQETIFTSCAMPTRFKTAFSVLYNKGKPPHFSKRRFLALRIGSHLSDEHHSLLLAKQQASQLLSGGDRTRIFPAAHIHIERILKSYSLPLLYLDYERTERTLTEYYHASP